MCKLNGVGGISGLTIDEGFNEEAAKELVDDYRYEVVSVSKWSITFESKWGAYTVARLNHKWELREMIML